MSINLQINPQINPQKKYKILIVQTGRIGNLILLLYL